MSWLMTKHQDIERQLRSKGLKARLNIHISYILLFTEHPPSTNPAEIQVYDYCSALAQLMTEYEKSLHYFYVILKST